jgi:hypothetical protein
LPAALVTDRLQQAIALGRLGVSFTVGAPVAGMSLGLCLTAQPLVKSIIRIGAHLVALPGRFARPLAFRLWAAAVILMTHTAFTQIPAAAADNLFHGRHRYLSYEGWKKEERNQRSDMEIFT